MKAKGLVVHLVLYVPVVQWQGRSLAALQAFVQRLINQWLTFHLDI